jgi:uncharacterized protein (TIGR00255 family)
MLRSMTGFGTARSVVGDEEITVELRSVNHKYCEVKARLPRELSALETAIVRRVKNRVSRGSLEVTVKRSSRVFSSLVPVVDSTLAKAYRRALAELSAAAEVPDTTSAKDLAQMPNVLRLEEPQVDLDRIGVALEMAIDQSLSALEAMRAVEGQAIERDLLGRLDLVTRSVKELTAESPASVDAYRTRLAERIAELAQGVAVDPQRLAQEVAFFAERCDVAEELTRLSAHLDQFRAVCASDEPAGRKLDFLVQEMNREVNTTGSKSASAAITTIVVQLKAELERVREQVQNVE